MVGVGMVGVGMVGVGMVGVGMVGVGMVGVVPEGRCRIERKVGATTVIIAAIIVPKADASVCHRGLIVLLSVLPLSVLPLIDNIHLLNQILSIFYHQLSLALMMAAIYGFVETI